MPQHPPAAALSATPRLRLEAISKRYPQVIALSEVDLSVAAGEIHAVLGENGAGKSTLMNIIGGVTRASSGRIYWQGKQVDMVSPRVARDLGIGMVFQQFALFETLSVAENIALGLSVRWSRRELAARIEGVAERYGLPLAAQRLVHTLSVPERQRVAIIRCLLQQPRLLILDEPTAALAPNLVAALFATLRQLAGEGCAILFISHKLEEIRALCHSATILRNGRVSGACQPAQETPQMLARLMIGADLPRIEHPPAAGGGETRLLLNRLCWRNPDAAGVSLYDLELSVDAGEIVGIAGVAGNGQQELLRLLSGEESSADKGCLRMMGVQVGRLSPAARRTLGLAVVSDERLGRSAVAAMTLTENVLLSATPSSGLTWRGLIRASAVRAFAARCIRQFGVKCSGETALAQSLSAGNLQKFLLGREILSAPRLLIVAQPTSGVDVAAAAFIHQSLIELRQRGCAILLFSEDLDELFTLCERIAVISQGRLSPARLCATVSSAELGVAMGGGGKP